MSSLRRMRIPFLIALVALCVIPQIASAHSVQIFPTGYWGPLTSCSGNPFSGPGMDATTTAAGGLPPCRNICDFFHTVQHVLYFFLTALIFVIAPIAIVAGGIMMMVSGGSPGLYNSGKSAIFGAAIGIALGLGAFLIINTFLWIIFGSTTGDPTGKTNVAWPNLYCSVPDYELYKPPPPSPEVGTRPWCLAVCEGQPNKECRNVSSTWQCVPSTTPPPPPPASQTFACNQCSSKCTGTGKVCDAAANTPQANQCVCNSIVQANGNACQQRGGTCQNQSTSCDGGKGTYVTGKCPGPASNLCCVPAPTGPRQQCCLYKVKNPKPLTAQCALISSNITGSCTASEVPAFRQNASLQSCYDDPVTTPCS